MDFSLKTMVDMYFSKTAFFVFVRTGGRAGGRAGGRTDGRTDGQADGRAGGRRMVGCTKTNSSVEISSGLRIIRISGCCEDLSLCALISAKIRKR